MIMRKRFFLFVASIMVINNSIMADTSSWLPQEDVVKSSIRLLECTYDKAQLARCEIITPSSADWEVSLEGDVDGRVSPYGMEYVYEYTFRAKRALESAGVAVALDRCAGGRLSYYYEPHGTVSLGKAPNPGGDYQWYNNLLTTRKNLGEWDEPGLPIEEEGNSFALKNVRLEEKEDGWYLSLTVEPDSLQVVPTRFITTSVLRNTITSKQAFTNPDGSAIKIDRDYTGAKRNRKRPCPGAFEIQKGNLKTCLVWEK